MTTSDGQFHVLTRHFFRQFIDNDLLSPESDQHQGLTLTVAGLLLPGLLVPTLKLFPYTYPFWTAAQRDAYSWGDKCLFVLLSMIVLAGVATLNWDALTVSRRDWLTLGPLPIRPWTLLKAKLASLGGLLGVFSLAIVGVGPVWFPFVVQSGDRHATWTQYGRLMVGHGVSMLAAGAFAFFTVVALHGVLVNVFGPHVYRRVATWVQSAAIFVLAVTFLMLPLITFAVEPLKRASHPALFWAPPFWFLGIWQVIAGAGDPAWNALAVLGWAGLLGMAVAAVALNAAGFARSSRNAIEAGDGRSGPFGILRPVGRAIGSVVGGRRPAVRAFFMFSVRTLARSPRHRLVLAASLGAGFALAAVSIASSAWRSSRFVMPTTEGYLSAQLLLIFALVAGARVAAARPAELPAAWVLRLLYPGEPAAWLSGLRRAIVAGLVLPLLVVLFPVHAYVIGWEAAGRHAVLCLVLAAGLVEAMFLGFRRVPFASTHAAGSGGVNMSWTWYWFGFTFYAFTLANLEAFIVQNAVAFMWLLPIGLAALGALIWFRQRSLRDGLALQFVDEPVWETQKLDLSAG
jgi:hypothetical protein